MMNPNGNLTNNLYEKKSLMTTSIENLPDLNEIDFSIPHKKLLVPKQQNFGILKNQKQSLVLSEIKSIDEQEEEKQDKQKSQFLNVDSFGSVIEDDEWEKIDDHNTKTLRKE